MAIHAVYRVDWTEYERGWGSRPDGYNLYATYEQALEGLKAVHGDRSGPAPDCYINGSIPRIVEVDSDTYWEVQKGSVYKLR